MKLSELQGLRGLVHSLRGKRTSHRWGPVLAVIGILLLIAPPPVASAHGEQGQQAFERTSTVLFYDVNFSTENLNIGDELTITGTLRVMNAWPDHTIDPPDLGFLTVNQPGPVFYIEDREMSGMFTPQSVKLTKGGVYPFRLVLKARIPGTWHIHPAMAVKGTGTLMGPGAYVTINDSGVFTEPQLLANGTTADLTNYGLPRVITWQLIGFLFGAAYAVYWLRKSLLQRAAVVNSGGGAGLVTKTERKVSIAFGIGALVLGLGGFIYATVSDGPHVPLQVARLAPIPEAPSPLSSKVQTKVENAVFDADAGTLALTVQVTNANDTPVYFDHLQFADLELANKEGAPPGLPANTLATVTPPGPIQAGETREMTITVDAGELKAQNLLPLNDAQVRITGLMFFKDASGTKAASEINELSSGILPKFD
ncbi:methane monooxygenase/ammonia monooxygenase subunit B [Mycobacterium antarcticum]|uniref:methane monooxygenase/ammonia monooxygenase subunit B n=1 Tax=Mycolicibacterium sp. TUM20985 TaxID=3023370 RepID=UPI0025722D15|nr:methane monooxygenase/ammonia monooxygenase subunit B [Mycolicibacterium sp. TUM20985]